MSLVSPVLSCSDKLPIVELMESVVLQFRCTPSPPTVMLSWLEEITAVTQALLNQNSCSGIPAILESPPPPQKESNGVRYKKKKVRISLRFSYFPVFFS